MDTISADTATRDTDGPRRVAEPIPSTPIRPQPIPAHTLDRTHGRPLAPVRPRSILAIPTPADLLGVARGVVTFAVDSVTLVASLPTRVEAIFAQIEDLIAAVETLLARVTEVTEDAGAVVLQVESTAGRATVLIGDIEPIAEKAIPLGHNFVNNISDDELLAAVKMVDYLPELLQRMDALVPILAQLDSVAPELHQLLNVTKDVRRAVIGIPGFRFFRNRGDNILDER